MDNNEIIKSLQEEMAQKEKEYNLYGSQLKQLNQEMEDIKNEYNTKKASLEANIERVRGAYTVIYNQLKKFGVIQETQPTEKEVKVDEKVKTETKSKAVKKATDVKSEKKSEKDSGLTKEEIDKISKAVSNNNVKDANGNVVPDYLQAEYKK